MNFNTLFKSKEEISSSRNSPIFLFLLWVWLYLKEALWTICPSYPLNPHMPPSIRHQSVKQLWERFFSTFSRKASEWFLCAESICSLCLLGKRGIDLSPSLISSGHSSLEGCKYIGKNFRQSQEWINQIQFREDIDKQSMAHESIKGLENITYREKLQKKRTKRRLRTKFITVYGEMNLLEYCSGAIIDVLSPQCPWEPFLNFSYFLCLCWTNHNLI